MNQYDRAEYEFKVASKTEAYKNGDLKTERMWLKEGYRIKPGAKPCRMWWNGFRNGASDYYFREDVYHE